MTKTAQKLFEELERLPADEQEERASSYLEDLKRRKGAREERLGEGEKELYEPFAVLLEANLDLPPDASVTYERELYGRTADLDD